MKDILFGFALVFGFLAVALILSLGGMVFFIARGGQKERFRKLIDSIQRRDFQLPDPELPALLQLSPFAFAREIHARGKKLVISGLSDIREFERSSPPTCIDGFHFSEEGRLVTVFGHSHSSGSSSGKGGGTLHYQCAAMDQEGLPRFRLRKKSFGHSLAGKIISTAGKIRPFEFSRQLDFTENPAFASLHDVTIEPGHDESAVRNFLTPQRLNHLVSHPMQGEIVVGGEKLVYLETGRFSDDASYDEFVAHARSALAWILGVH